MSNASQIGTYATFVFAFIMLVYWIAAFVILYHLIRFGIGSHPKKVAVAFLGGSLILSIITTLFYAQVLF